MAKKKDNKIQSSRELDNLRRAGKKTAKKESFLTLRMWADTLLSFLKTDRGRIPKDIGNRILVTNNLAVTEYSMTGVVMVVDYSVDTPVALPTHVIREVKRSIDNVRIDFTLKLGKYTKDTSTFGARSKRSQWVDEMNNPATSTTKQEHLARLIYSTDILNSGVEAMQAATFIQVHASTASTLKRAIRKVITTLAEYNIQSVHLKSNLSLQYPYILSTTVAKGSHIKDIPKTVFTTQTLSESLPISQGMATDRGVLIGIDVNNDTPYFVNFREIKAARNVLLVAQSGSGKSLLAYNLVLNAIADDYNIIVYDIKGNDYTNIIKAAGGSVLSMRPGHAFVFNHFKLNLENRLIQETPTEFYDRMLTLSEQVLLTILDDKSVKTKNLISSFLKHLYVGKGVMRNNVNTYANTNDLSFVEVFANYKRFVNSPYIQQEFAEDLLITSMLSFENYFSVNGPEHYVFEKEYTIQEDLNSVALSFDFGLLNATTVNNQITFNLKTLYASVIEEYFIDRKKIEGKWTIKVVEEIQMKNKFITQQLIKDATVRRSWNQVTVMIGNSVSSLTKDTELLPVFENITMLLVGSVVKSARETLIDEFDLTEQDLEAMTKIATDPEIMNHFLMVDRSRKGINAEIKVHLPQSALKSDLFS